MTERSIAAELSARSMPLDEIVEVLRGGPSRGRARVRVCACGVTFTGPARGPISEGCPGCRAGRVADRKREWRAKQ